MCKLGNLLDTFDKHLTLDAHPTNGDVQEAQEAAPADRKQRKRLCKSGGGDAAAAAAAAAASPAASLADAHMEDAAVPETLPDFLESQPGGGSPSRSGSIARRGPPGSARRRGSGAAAAAEESDEADDWPGASPNSPLFSPTSPQCTAASPTYTPLSPACAAGSPKSGATAGSGQAAGSRKEAGDAAQLEARLAEVARLRWRLERERDEAAADKRLAAELAQVNLTNPNVLPVIEEVAVQGVALAVLW